MSNMLDINVFDEGMALMTRTEPTTHGCMAQAITCIRQACEAISCAAVRFAEYIDVCIEIEHAQ